MGIKFSFCSCGPYFLRERLSKEDFCHEKASSKAWIVKTIKQTFLLRKKKKKMGMEFKLTLEEWLLKSPIMEKDGNYCNGEHCGFKHQYGSDYHCPSLTRKKAYFSDSRVYSLSLEQLLDGDDYTTLSVDYSNISLEKLPILSFCIHQRWILKSEYQCISFFLLSQYEL